MHLNHDTRTIVLAGLTCLTLARTGEPVRAQAPNGGNTTRSVYVLGPNDLIIVRATDVDGFADTPIRIDPDGFIRLPMAGRIHAAGLSIEQLEQSVSDGLRTYVRQPQVSVSVAEYNSRPVSIIGAVKSPGVQQLAGRKTLMEVLAAAGGLEPDAGHIVTITRRPERGRIEVPQVRTDPDGVTVATIDLASLLEARIPADNIVVAPDDVITVPRGKLVYVVGEVHKSGAFLLRDGESLSVLKALSLAEGALRTAGLEHARILRKDPDAPHPQEIPVALNRIIAGDAPDVMMHQNDVLYIPNSMVRNAVLRGLEAAIQLGIGVVIWRN